MEAGSPSWDVVSAWTSLMSKDLFYGQTKDQSMLLYFDVQIDFLYIQNLNNYRLSINFLLPIFYGKEDNPRKNLIPSILGCNGDENDVCIDLESERNHLLVLYIEGKGIRKQIGILYNITRFKYPISK